MKPTPDFDPAVAAKKLLREGRSGALATLMPGSGDPYCSLVNVATAADGAPLLLISRLAVHTKNILADPRVSLMIDERKEGDPLQGRARHADGNRGRDRRPGRAPALSRPPAGGGDVRRLRRFRLLPDDAQGRASGRRLRPHRRSQAAGHPDRDRRRRRAGRGRARDPRAHERRPCRRLRLYATKLLGAPDGDWRCVGCDPEGLELQLDRTALRLPFPQRVRAPGVLRQVLKQLAEQARAA